MFYYILRLFGGGYLSGRITLIPVSTYWPEGEFWIQVSSYLVWYTLKGLNMVLIYLYQYVYVYVIYNNWLQKSELQIVTSSFYGKSMQNTHPLITLIVISSMPWNIISYSHHAISQIVGLTLPHNSISIFWPTSFHGSLCLLPVTANHYSTLLFNVSYISSSAISKWTYAFLILTQFILHNVPYIHTYNHKNHSPPFQAFASPLCLHDIFQSS